MNDKRLQDLTISLLPSLHVTEKLKLMEEIKTEDELLLQSKNDIEKIINRSLKNFWDMSEARDRAGSIDTICAMRSIKWVSYFDPDYPPLLREAYDPPPVIYYRGELPNPEKSLIGIVGTRKPSREAAEQVYKIAGNLGRAGISVVSGLALGIDAMAHRGNLIGNAPGYAVLGCGIDEIYPSSNKPLAKRILDSGGAIISEYPPGTAPARWTFPARNRIIAALSRSVLIAEAPEKSGALITAAFALDQGKDLWVASCGVQEDSAEEKIFFDKRGTTKLAYDGAEIIYSASDILERWNLNDTQAEKTHTVINSGREELVSSVAELLKIDI